MGEGRIFAGADTAHTVERRVEHVHVPPRIVSTAARKREKLAVWTPVWRVRRHVGGREHDGTRQIVNARGHDPPRHGEGGQLCPREQCSVRRHDRLRYACPPVLVRAVDNLAHGWRGGVAPRQNSPRKATANEVFRARVTGRRTRRDEPERLPVGGEAGRIVAPSSAHKHVTHGPVHATQTNAVSLWQIAVPRLECGVQLVTEGIKKFTCARPTRECGASRTFLGPCGRACAQIVEAKPGFGTRVALERERRAVGRERAVEALDERLVAKCRQHYG